jgi:formamidopyrimidine-DNA glycosylase
MNEKTLTIARALSKHYGVELPDFLDDMECHQWIKSILNKSNAQLKRCSYCGTVLMRKLVNGKLRYVCKGCGKTFALKGV